MWFSGICFSIVSSLYKLRDLSVKEAKARKVGAKEKEGERREVLKGIIAYVLQVVSRSLAGV